MELYITSACDASYAHTKIMTKQMNSRHNDKRA